MLESSSDRRPGSFCSAEYACSRVVTTLEARSKTNCATISPRDRLSRRWMRAIQARWMTLSTTTASPTRRTTPATCLVLTLRRIVTERSRPGSRAGSALVFLAIGGITGRLVFLRLEPVQLVVQGLQADPEDLGCFGLVLARMFQC